MTKTKQLEQRHNRTMRGVDQCLESASKQVASSIDRLREHHEAPKYLPKGPGSGRAKRQREDGKAADGNPVGLAGGARQKPLAHDELSAMVQAHQKEKWDAETAKIDRLKALRLSREAAARASKEPGKRIARRSKYLGGYE